MLLLMNGVFPVPPIRDVSMPTEVIEYIRFALLSKYKNLGKLSCWGNALLDISLSNGELVFFLRCIRVNREANLVALNTKELVFRLEFLEIQIQR